MINIDNTIKKLIRLEPLFFYLIVLLYLVPVLAFKFFPTVDGPAHLYNSNLIFELWTNPDGPIINYFQFNNTITPNWSGHFLLSILRSILPGFMAEKLVLIFYLAGFPLAIRYLFKQIGINSKYLIYLIFPFTYSYLFYYGFYNYNLGLVFLFLGIGLWIKLNKEKSLLSFIKLTLISTVICFSHLFVFGVFLIVIFILSFDQFRPLWGSGKNERIDSIKNYFFQLTCVTPGIILLFLFLFSDKTLDASTTYLPINDLLVSLKYIMPVKGIHYDQYGFISKTLLYTFTSLIFWLLAVKTYNLFSKKELSLTHKNWLLICLSIFMLIFILPDYIGAAAGFISARLISLFFIFLIIWLSTQVFPKWLIGCLFIVIGIVNIMVVIHNYRAQSNSHKITTELNKVAQHIEDYSVILPIVYTDNFLDKHISNYLGAEKPLIILENYETSMNHFPLVWNYEKIPFLHLGDLELQDCISWPKNNLPAGKKNN